MVLIKNFRERFIKITHENSGIVFQKKTTLNFPVRAQNQVTSASRSLHNFYYHFADIVSDTVD